MSLTRDAGIEVEDHVPEPVGSPRSMTSSGLRPPKASLGIEPLSYGLRLDDFGKSGQKRSASRMRRGPGSSGPSPLSQLAMARSEKTVRGGPWWYIKR